MPTIQKPALRNLANELKARHDADPSVKVDTKVLDQIISIVGDRWLASSASVADKLRNGHLLPEEKLALAKKGLDGGEKQDVQALLGEREGFAPSASSGRLHPVVGERANRELDGSDPTHGPRVA